MKKLGIIFITLLILILLSSFSVNAVENSEYEYDFSGVYDSLSEDAKQHLLGIGADSAEPTTGTNELSANLTVLPDTLSSEFVTTCFIPSTEVKIIITNAKSHLNAFEINDVKPLKLMSGDSPPETESPRNIFKKGSIILCAA